MQDFYKILGVDEAATQEQIKKAFRQLAKQYHPDNQEHGDDQKFKEINQAYDILGDAAKRQQYNQQRKFGGNFQQWHHTGGPAPFEFHANFGGDINEIFENFFGRGGFNPFSQSRPMRNPDQVVQITITLEDAFSGTSLPIQWTNSSQQTTQLNVNIPAGIEHGTRIRYPGNGSRANPNLPPGDLIIIVHLQPHTRFERHSSNLITTLDLNLWESLIGTEKMIQTICNQQIKVTVPELSTANTILRVPHKGMPLNSGTNSRGDLLIKLNIPLPTKLTQEQISIIQNWAKPS
jgi:curved DNA-binding protein